MNKEQKNTLLHLVLHYSHVIHFRWVGEGKKLGHIKPRCAIFISKIEAALLLQVELKETRAVVKILQITG